MAGLVLKLGPRERVMVNGVVMENGDRRTRLNIISSDAKVLRLRDALHPDEANTPVKRVCYIAQLIIAGEADPKEGKSQLLRGIEQLSQVFVDTESRLRLDAANDATLAENFYPALKSLRHLIEREAELLAHSHRAAS